MVVEVTATTADQTYQGTAETEASARSRTAAVGIATRALSAMQHPRGESNKGGRMASTDLGLADAHPFKTVFTAYCGCRIGYHKSGKAGLRAAVNIRKWLRRMQDVE